MFGFARTEHPFQPLVKRPRKLPRDGVGRQSQRCTIRGAWKSCRSPRGLWVVDDNPCGHHGFVIDAGPPGDDWRALAGPDSDGELWWTPERAALVRWLDRCAPALVPLYMGALRLTVLDSFPGRVHFIAHAIREICNRLPGALGPEVKRRDAGYGPLTDKIHDQWVAEGLPEDGTPRLPDETVPSASGPRRQEVSVELLESVGRLIADHNKA